MRLLSDFKYRQPIKGHGKRVEGKIAIEEINAAAEISAIYIITAGSTLTYTEVES
jgi:hypothetical protein